MQVVRITMGISMVVLASTTRLSAQADAGRDGYKEECKSCHGINGVPPERAVQQYPKIKALGLNGFVSALSEDSIVTILKKGIDKDMKSFSSKLSEAEMTAVAKYIKALASRRKDNP